jgi:hypothetical protein
MVYCESLYVSSKKCCVVGATTDISLSLVIFSDI